jgi:phosphate transport system substrate-binding protein
MPITTKILLFLLMCQLLSSCASNENTPTQGNQKIYIDESYQPLFESEIETFEGFYQQSDIIGIYLPEADIVSAFLKDSCRVAVLSRDLKKEERDFMASKKSFPVSTKIAVDAIAFITHKNNPLKNLTYNELKKIFTGEINAWKYLDSSIKPGSPQDTSITIVFDNEKSCNVRYIKERFLERKEFPKNVFAVNSNPEVIDYVSRNKHALGIIGVNWISDPEDTLTRTFLSKINVLAVSSQENPGEFYQPYEAYIHEKKYPFIRDVFIHNAEGKTGLGTGFAAFVASEKGQLIILKAGMVPATQPIRVVTITTE